jgi:hypothetical protein
MTHPLPIRDTIIVTCVIVHGANRCTAKMPMKVLAAHLETQAIRKDDGAVDSIFPIYVAVMHATFKRLWRQYGVVL